MGLGGRKDLRGVIMKKAYLIFSLLFVLLGIVHAACTPVFYHSYSLDALWFAGTGLGVTLAGLLNISAIKADNSQVYSITIVSNIVCLILFVLIALLVGFEIQLIAGIVLIVSMLVLSVYSWRRAK